MSTTTVTGQQIGLLGGPLYTAYKVLGAAVRAKENSGRAIYWLETNDADFNEINHIDFLDAGGSLRTLTWDIDSRGYSCGLITIDRQLPQLLESFFSAIHQTEFTPTLRKLALHCYQPGRTLGEASMLLARELLDEIPIRLFDPMDSDFRQFSREILLKEAEKTPVGEQCNLFAMDGPRRRAVFREQGGFRFRDGETVDLHRLPLVPNVKTRSVCQDAYFATDEYIAGPGEVKYLGEMTDQFRFHGVKPAAVVPRMSVTLIEPRLRRLLDKTGLAVNDVLTLSREELLQQRLARHSGFDMKAVMEEAHRLSQQFLEDIAALGLDTTALRKKLGQEIKAAAGKKRALEKERHQTLLRATAQLVDALMPFGKRQERVFNLFYYMNLYGGQDFIQWLYRHYDWNADILEVTNA